MNRNEMPQLMQRQVGPVDVVAVERQARAMQAQMMSELLRLGWRRAAGWLRREPSGQTA